MYIFCVQTHKLKPQKIVWSLQRTLVLVIDPCTIDSHAFSLFVRWQTGLSAVYVVFHARTLPSHLVLHNGIFLNLSQERYIGFSYHPLSIISITPPLPTVTLTAVQSSSTIWPLPRLIYFQHGFGCLNAPLFSIFKITLLYLIYLWLTCLYIRDGVNYLIK